jgi:UDP-GlcNAc:undecaprenyl-phosphate/decaprenyl-phosphate GlcNAc-1-phosphate transferase
VREYAVVLLTAALVTFLSTPVVRMVAIRARMLAAPRERDVHVIPTPRGGGVAM